MLFGGKITFFKMCFIKGHVQLETNSKSGNYDQSKC